VGQAVERIATVQEALDDPLHHASQLPTGSLESPLIDLYEVLPVVCKDPIKRTSTKPPETVGRILLSMDTATLEHRLCSCKVWRVKYSARPSQAQAPALFDWLCSCLVPANAAWAAKAPLLTLSVARTFFERNGKPNAYAHYDVGLAVGQMLIQATSMGLVVHQMAGYDKERARDLLKIPGGYEPVAMIAIGYQGDPNALPDDLKAREPFCRKRPENPVPSDLVHPDPPGILHRRRQRHALFH
jgi:nitroreductase